MASLGGIVISFVLGWIAFHARACGWRAALSLVMFFATAVGLGHAFAVSMPAQLVAVVAGYISHGLFLELCAKEMKR